MTGPAFDLVTRRLAERTGYHPPRENGPWRCPAHDDRNPSLSVSNGDGKVLIKCHGACDISDILTALDLKPGDLFDESKRPSDERSRVVATYTYTDEQDRPLFLVRRWEPGFDGKRKSFTQHRPDGTKGIAGVRRVLYRLPAVLDSIVRGVAVFVVEGEKDVHAIEAAGAVATCNPAGGESWRAEYGDYLAGAAQVIVIRDKDATGVKWAADVEASIAGKVDEYVIVEARTGKDAADHLGAGHTLEELQVIDASEPPAAAAQDDLDPSLYPVDLAPVLKGTADQPIPTQLRRDDGASLLYAGAVNGIHGDSGSGKGWVACYLVQQNAAVGVRTMILDFEDTAHSITARLRLLGMTDHEILTWVVYLRPQVPFGGLEVAHMVNLIEGENIGATIVDSVGEAFGLAGVNEDKDVEVGPWLRMVARPLADTGSSLNLIDHSTKAGTNDLHPSGSKRKRAAITGASYLAEAVKPFVKDQGGRLRLTCAKDRHGNYRRGQVVGDLVMDSSPGAVRLKLYAPTITTGEADATVPVVLAARKAVAAAKDAGRPLTRNELEARMAVKGRAQLKRAGIDHAAAEGALGEQSGPRNSRVFTYRHDLEETA